MNSGRATTEVPPSLPATLHIRGVEDLLAHEGQELGVSHWHTLGQQHIDDYADLTGDTQWIHTDPDLASNGLFGATVAHGFFTLAHATWLLWEIAVVDHMTTVINYGLNRVRFPAPVRAGSRIRVRASLRSAREMA